MRSDPVMMAELGGPQPREGMAAKVACDVQQAAADTAWIKMIIPDGSAPGVVAGSVALWSHEDSGTAMSEIGWMVLPEFQGRGIATTAVRMLLELAREQERWGWCTRVRRSRTSPPSASAARPDSDLSKNRRRPSPGACSAPITGLSIPPPT